MRKILLLVLLILFLVLVLSGIKIGKLGLRSRAAPASSLSFTIPQISLDTGVSFPVIVNIEPNSINQVTAVELHISFDPKILRLESVVPSQIFSQTLSNPIIDNAVGNTSIDVAVPLQNTNSTPIIFPVGGYPENSVPPFSTSDPAFLTTTNKSPVVVLNFTAQTQGATTLNFSNLTQASALGEAGNVLTALNSGTLTIGPPATPTTASQSCGCQNTNICGDCNFSLYPDVSYASPISCFQSPNNFLPGGQPTQTNKNSWCQRSERTKGDTNGDNLINTTDYFYYVASVNGGHIPPGVDPDINGDGETGISDRIIIVRSLSQ